LLPASADEFLHALLGNDPSLEPLKQLLIARTEGNPFFLEESVRTLVEAGVLVGERGAYRLAQALPTIQVPATVQAVLAARIDRLPPEEKRLLQTAAVIGTEVSLPLLQAIAELPEAALQGGLTHLQAAEFLYETRLFPEREYTFKHALTHEVAYSTLLQKRRHALHAQIVEALEALSPDRVAEQVERLARHALRGKVWAKALTYCRQAGTKAATRSANREAVMCIEQALTALQHLPKSRDTMEQGIDLRFDLRNALLPLAEHGRIFDSMREAEALCEALDDQHRLGRVFSYMARSFFAVGDHDRAVESGQHALAIAAALEDVGLQVVTNFYLGVIYQLSGDYRRAIAFLRQTVALLEGEPSRKRVGLPYLPSVFARSFLVRCLAELGEFAEGSTRGEEGCRIAEAVDQPWDLLVAYFGLGLLYLYKGELRTAIPILERGLSLCQASDIPEWFSSTASELGLAYALSGRLTEALRLLEESVQLAISIGRRGRQSLWVARLSEGYLLAGRLEDATNHAMSAFELSCEHKEQGHQALSRWLSSPIHHAQGLSCQPGAVGLSPSPPDVDRSSHISQKQPRGNDSHVQEGQAAPCKPRRQSQGRSLQRVAPTVPAAPLWQRHWPDPYRGAPSCASFTQSLCGLLEDLLLQGRHFTEDPPGGQDVLEFLLRQATQLCRACKGALPLPVEGNGTFDAQLWP
jgi:tetratricopeptide (TPR) repeat protein